MKKIFLIFIILQINFYVFGAEKEYIPNRKKSVPFGYYQGTKEPLIYFLDRIKFGLDIEVKFSYFLGEKKNKLNPKTKYKFEDNSYIPAECFNLFFEIRNGTNFIGLRLNLGFAYTPLFLKYFKTDNIIYMSLNLPVRIYPFRKRCFCLFIGPEINFPLSASESEKGKSTINELDIFSYGLCCGLEYQAKMGLFFGTKLSYNLNFNYKRIFNKKTVQIDYQYFTNSVYIGYDFAPLL